MPKLEQTKLHDQVWNAYDMYLAKKQNQLFSITDSSPTKLGPVVQSVVSLTSLLVVKMLTALVSTISNSQVFLLKKC